MLSEEVKKYRKLSGDDDPNTPISRIGGYLDGYEKTVEHLPSVMREAMPEERDGVERYIDSIAEPCEDCISREEAIKMFTYNYKGERIPDYDCDNFPVQIAMKTVKKILRNLPPVTPQPKIGHWTHDGSHWENRFICSACGYKLFDEQTNYCPNCGAKMQEVEE